MKDKLDILLKNKGLSATSLARILGIQPSGLSHILSGRNKPSFDLVVKILRAFPDLNPDWLLLDSEEIFRTEAAQPGDGPLFSDTLPIHQSDTLQEAHQNIEFSESKNQEENLPMHNFSSAKNSGKPVDRIVIFYADGTFESFSEK